MARIRTIALLFALLIGIDQACGFLLDTLYRRTTSGELGGGLINLALKQDPDILVLGSSRAKYHVSPAVLRERLSMSAFNAGINGQDFLYAVMLLDLWTRSHRPPGAIILNMDPRSLLRSEDEIDRTSVFAPYIGDSPTVRRILLMRGRYAGLKYLSYSYRFNGKVLSILKNLGTRPDPGFDGYIPVQGSLADRGGAENTFDERQDSGSAAHGAEPAPSFWDFKLEHLQEIARYCRENGTRLFLIAGPVLRPDAGWGESAQRIARLSSSYPGVEFLDLSERTHPEAFAGQSQLFTDNIHLNARGAVVFSRLLADAIADPVRRSRVARVRISSRIREPKRPGRLQAAPE